MNKNKVTGRERMQDAAEAWLAKNDPDYVTEKKKWQTPSTDALARDREKHHSMKESSPINPGADDGNYRKYPKSGHAVGRKFENELAIESNIDEELES